MNSSLYQQLVVDLGERSYPIYIGEYLLTDSSLFANAIHSNQILIVTNETIAPLYLQQVVDTLQSKAERIVKTVVLPDGEQHKHLDTITLIYDQLLAHHFDRSCCLVALGGGVVGDMTGFAAATYQRGVQFVQLPTTLLAQVDSSVGGKTGVNHVAGKNMIGAFHQPQAVIIDTTTLNTLPEREFIAGLAEVIKYGLITDKPFLDWLSQQMPALLARDATSLAKAIYDSCLSKAKVVASDEKEAGIRAILNLGHTFGHAFEAATAYQYWLHGEAVGFGMLMALDLSKRLGLLSDEDVAYANAIILAAGLPQQAPQGMDVETISVFMASDKKVLEGQLRLVLLQSLGEAFVSSDFSKQQLHETLNHFLAN